MNYFKQFFNSSSTKLSAELAEKPAAAKSPAIDTAICPTPDQARRIVRTANGLELVLTANDVAHLEVIQNMFDDLKRLDGKKKERTEQTPSIVIPISINSQTMHKIIEWIKTLKNPTETENSSKFLENLDIPQCLQLIDACLFLEIPQLAELAAKSVAARLEGKTASEMATCLQLATFGLVDEQNRENLRVLKELTMPV